MGLFNFLDLHQFQFFHLRFLQAPFLHSRSKIHQSGSSTQLSYLVITVYSYKTIYALYLVLILLNLIQDFKEPHSFLVGIAFLEKSWIPVWIFFFLILLYWVVIEIRFRVWILEALLDGHGWSFGFLNNFILHGISMFWNCSYKITVCWYYWLQLNLVWWWLVGKWLVYWLVFYGNKVSSELSALQGISNGNLDSNFWSYFGQMWWSWASYLLRLWVVLVEVFPLRRGLQVLTAPDFVGKLGFLACFVH